MTNLSVNAQAILDAYQLAPIDDELTAAAILRAAADLIYPDWDARCCHEVLNAIAAELEAL